MSRAAPMRTRNAARRALVVVAVLGVAAAVLPTGAVASVRGIPSPPTKVLVVSGSSLAGVAMYNAYSGFTGAQYTFDLQACRRSHGTSCSVFGKKPPPTVLDVVKAKGAGHSTLIVFAGYNEGTATLSKGFDLVVGQARAKGITRIIWATLRTNHDYTTTRIAGLRPVFDASNAMLRAKVASGLYDDVTLADWDTYSTNETTWFIKDGVHFTRSGAWGAADYLSRKLAFLENRACPVPRTPTEAPQNPCPDPDTRPPDVNLPASYPIGPNSLSCFVVPSDVHIECRPTALVGKVTSTLTYGMKGTQVRALQTELRSRGFLSGFGINGTFDRRTFQALMAFQQWRELPLSGVAGPATRAALGFGCAEHGALGSACPPDAQPTYFLVPTKIGASGFLVRLLQTRLAGLGHFTAKVNGVFSSSTRTALRSFQTANALPVTGIADAATVAALGFQPLP